MTSLGELMRRLKGWRARGTCPECGMNDAERAVALWTKEEAAKTCNAPLGGWPVTGLCIHCGATDADRDLAAYFRQQVLTLIGVLKAGAR